MIKKILFVILLAILAVLSLALYNQYSMLPDGTVADEQPAQQDKGVLERTWAPPQPEPEPQPEETKELATWTEDAGQQPVPEQPARPAPAPPSRPEQKQAPQAAAPPADADAPQQEQAQEPPAEESIDEQLGKGELTEALPDPPAEQDPVDDEDAASKAEKALHRGKSWLQDQGREAEEAVEAGKKELEQEQEVMEEMHLSRKEETSPDAEVDRLVKKLEKRSLEQEDVPAQSSEASRPPETTEPARTAKAPEPAKPAPSPARPKSRNQLTSLLLSSDGEAVMLRVTTSKAIEGRSSFKINAPRRFVLDLHGSFVRSVPRVNVLPNAMVEDLRTGLHPDKLRIVADLHDDVDAQITVEPQSPTELLVIMRPRQ